jgi:hypothetical protein
MECMTMKPTDSFTPTLPPTPSTLSPKETRALWPTLEESRVEREQARLRAFVQSRLKPADYLAFSGTFRVEPSREAAVRAYRHYDLRLNKEVLGRRFDRRSNRLQTFVVLEGGEGPWDKRIHLHAVTEIPASFDPEAFARASADVWGAMEGTSARYSTHLIADNPPGWVDYITKLGSKPRGGYADGVLWECVQLGHREAA